MVKSIFLFRLIFFATLCFGQKEEIESVMNVAYKEIVPSNFEYFNLIDSSLSPDLLFAISPDIYHDKEFLVNNPDFPITDFSQMKFSNRLNWKNFEIEKSRIFDYKNIPKFQSQIKLNHLIPFNTPKAKVALMEKNRAFNEIILPVKKYWSRKKIEKKLLKKREAYSSKIRPEDKKYFIFSAPVFSKDQQFAIVKMHSVGYGFSCIFKKTSNGWKKIHLFDRWIS